LVGFGDDAARAGRRLFADDADDFVKEAALEPVWAASGY
jgi:hypothetical protein